ncbi:MAG: calcium-translocating P-type ATPase, SERCA-type [Firmicutes bacterium]|nr:calcium-translocating P-type ATPase, SERCA-type [Bacillota bacterium]
MENKLWHNRDIEDTLRELKVSKSNGLTEEEVKEKKEKYGLNQLKGNKGKSIFSMFIDQFKNFMVIILIIAAIISGSLGELKDSVIIVIIVILNAVIGVIQENKAEKSLEALKNMSKPLAKVIRNGSKTQIKSQDIVPGDIIVLEAGDSIPADGRIIESVNLKIEESALTGESVPVEKISEKLNDIEIPIGDRKNMVYSGSMVTYGRGNVVITETGMDTEIGNIAKLIQSQKKLKTPLQKKLDRMGKWLGLGALGICALIFLLGYIQGRGFLDMFMLAVSLAVAAIPEGLPAIVTIVLALGVQRMIKKNAIIRRLPAVETLGTASVICSDKTGTLTQNKMTVTKIYTHDKLIEKNNIDINENDKDLLLKIGVLCNDSSIEEKDGEKKTLGDPTETALVTLAYEKGLIKSEEENKTKRVNEIPFDSERKMMSTIHKNKNSLKVFTKGAPDRLIDKCSKILINDKVKDLTSEDKEKIKNANELMANDALRVLALGYKDLDKEPDNLDPTNIENDLIFVGLTGMIDPPREEVKLSVKECKKAGIKPVMITGDYKVTAIAIAKELGILESDNEAIDGKELDNIDDETLSNKVNKYSVYARVSPEHKVRIVKAWQSNKKIVAMTGDGVNDAPALKGANIGCAMGITGTDVSKEASDMILTDDNFSTIVKAVEEGRNIFSNIRKSIHFLLSCNIGEVLALMIALILKYESPLLPIHVLWINLVTDTLPALALGVDIKESDIMSKKPRDPKKSIFSDGLGFLIVIKGIAIGIVSIMAFNIGKKVDVSTGRTMAFAALCLSQIWNSLGVRSLDKPLYKIKTFGNIYLIAAMIISSILTLSVILIPVLRKIFEFSLLNMEQWGSIIVYSIIPLLLIEIYKGIKFSIKKN